MQNLTQVNPKYFHQLTQTLLKLVNLTQDLVYKKVHHMDYTMDHLQIPKHQLCMLLIQLLQQPKWPLSL